MHVLATSIPCFGHWRPVRDVARELYRRGHHITMLVERAQLHWCSVADADGQARPALDAFVPAPSTNNTAIALLRREQHAETGATFSCLVVPDSGRFTPAKFSYLSADDMPFEQSMIEMLSEGYALLQDTLDTFVGAAAPLTAPNASVSSGPPALTTVLTDSSMHTAYAFAAQHRLPAVSVFPMTGEFIPTAGLVTLSGTTGSRVAHFLIACVYRAVLAWWALPAVNAWFADYNARHAGVMPAIPSLQRLAQLERLDALTLTTVIPGLDVPSPHSSNVVHIGSTSITPTDALVDRQNLSAKAWTAVRRLAVLEPPLRQLLEEDEYCREQGVVYVNFGTFTFLSNRTHRTLLEGLLQAPFCYAWKVPELHRLTAVRSALAALPDPRRRGHNASARFFTAAKFWDAQSIMRHPNTRVFVSHCGDTSVLEAVAAQLPVAGLAIFADQGHVCRRVAASGIGLDMGPKAALSAAKVVQTLARLGTGGTVRKEALAHLAKIRRMSQQLGGAARGAAVIEAHHRHRLLSRPPAHALLSMPQPNPSSPIGLDNPFLIASNGHLLCAIFLVTGIVMVGAWRCSFKRLASATSTERCSSR